MQKVLRRTELAKRQAARVKLRKDAKIGRDERNKYLQELFEFKRSKRDHISTARKSHKEDWMLGPLAPRRSVGESSEKFGTIEQQQVSLPKAPKSKRIDAWHISEGDRVVCIRGRDRGKIGTVKIIERDSNSIQVSGLNVISVYVPEWRRKADNDPRPYRIMDGFLPIDDVRLICVVNGVNGNYKKQEVIAERVEIWEKEPELRRIDTSKIDGELDFENTFRVIPGITDSKISWPKKGEPRYQIFDSDTLRILLDEETFVPTLLRAPMPLSVIDELRNKYGKFRSDHDEEFIVQKLEEDEKEKRMIPQGRSMITPRMLLKQRNMKEKRDAPSPTLSVEQRQAIGRLMTKNLKLL